MKKSIISLISGLLLQACSDSSYVNPSLEPYISEVESVLGGIRETIHGNPINYEIGSLATLNGYEVLGKCFEVRDRDKGFKAKVIVDLQKLQETYPQATPEDFDAKVIALIAHEAAHCAFSAAHTHNAGLLIDDLVYYAEITAENIESKLLELKLHLDSGYHKIDVDGNFKF